MPSSNTHKRLSPNSKAAKPATCKRSGRPRVVRPAGGVAARNVVEVVFEGIEEALTVSFNSIWKAIAFSAVVSLVLLVFGRPQAAGALLAINLTWILGGLAVSRLFGLRTTSQGQLAFLAAIAITVG